MPEVTSQPNAYDAVERARDIIRGEATDFAEARQLIEQLKQRNEMGFARQLLARVRADDDIQPPGPDRLWLGQQHALCTYKDPHLADDTKFDQALRILNAADDLLATTSPETLGLAGAIHKYRWNALGQLYDLEQSAAYYQRGYNQGPGKDWGYTGINAAFVLDLLAYQADTFARKAGAAGSPGAHERRAQARAIRTELAARLPPMLDDESKTDWWFLATIAEACFGLQDFTAARMWLGLARNLQPEDWKFESTARQLAWLARLISDPGKDGGVETAPAWKVLEEFLGDVTAVRSVFIGRVGLALSGGGLRAALYHIGALAKLAEIDVLRHVEVISGVSGGSIVGAFYYLELQRLLETKPDSSITRDDYIAIVRRVADHFLAGSQRNIRTRLTASLSANLRMMFFPNYSRSDRLADLYESEFYARVDDGKANAPRFMDQLLVAPAGAAPRFSPRRDNWRRRAKVPVLVLNATALNTGHNWQFTATYMGEPPGAINSEVDGNYRLRRMYYSEAPPEHQRVRLGRAVAASACVPGLFDPVDMKRLYPDRTVRLVDGGVHDNQGVNALFEQDCTVLLVSDASGQMGTEDAPGNSPLTALLRSSSIMGARTRGAEYHDLEGRVRSSLLRGLMFIHLKKDLQSDPVNWTGCEDPVEASDEARPAFRRGGLASYGVRKDIQRLISDIRTDLDSFHDVEAFALMTSGYRMTATEFPRSVSGFPVVGAPSEPWPFLTIEEPMKTATGCEQAHQLLKQLLTTSSANAFKVWRLVPALYWSGLALAGAVVAAVFAAAYWGPSVELLTFRTAVILATAALAATVLGKAPVMALQHRTTIRRFLIGLGLCLVGWIAARLHLLVFDRLYLKLGQADRLRAMLPAHDRKSTAKAAGAP